MKSSDYIQRNPTYKKEYDNLNTLHKEFMKRETFKLAKALFLMKDIKKE
jgi:hypothetical protein